MGGLMRAKKATRFVAEVRAALSSLVAGYLSYRVQQQTGVPPKQTQHRQPASMQAVRQSQQA
jgi:hypothetical protein